MNAKVALYSAVDDEVTQNQGVFVVASTPEMFADHIKKEKGLWTKVVKETGVKPQ